MSSFCYSNYNILYALLYQYYCYIILYYIISYYIVSYHSCYIILHHIISYYNILYALASRGNTRALGVRGLGALFRSRCLFICYNCLSFCLLPVFFRNAPRLLILILSLLLLLLCTVGSHNFDLRHFKSRVSNPLPSDCSCPVAISVLNERRNTLRGFHPTAVSTDSSFVTA